MKDIDEEYIKLERKRMRLAMIHTVVLGLLTWLSWATMSWIDGGGTSLLGFLFFMIGTVLLAASITNTICWIVCLIGNYSIVDSMKYIDEMVNRVIRFRLTRYTGGR